MTATRAVVVAVVVGALGWLTLGLEDGAFPTDRADSTADWLAASAFAAGLDPHSDLRQLARSFGVRYWNEYEGSSSDRVTGLPRTPGAILLLYPLSWVTAEQARILMLGAGLVATAATFVVLWKSTVLAPAVVLVGAALAMVSGPARWAQLFVTQSAIVMLCVAIFLVGVAGRDTGRSGVALAIAGSLKVFPLVLVALLLARRRYRTLGVALGSLAILNLTPLIQPHLSLAAMIDAFSLTAVSWIDITPGLPGLFARWEMDPPVLVTAGVALTAALAVVFRARVGVGAGSLVLLAAVLLAMPLSWPHYLLSLIPPLVLASREIPARSFLGMAVSIGALCLVAMAPVGLHTIGLLIILAGVSFAVFLSPSALTRPVDHSAFSRGKVAAG